MCIAMSVAVIIVNWNGWKDTIECIRSLLRIDRDVNIVICDNGSTDGSFYEIQKWLIDNLPEINVDRSSLGRKSVGFRFLETVPHTSTSSDQCGITLIRSDSNLGFAGGNNVGLRYALAGDHSHFWLLNNDTTVAADALDRLLERVSEDDRIGICGSTLVYFDKPDVVQNLAGGGFKKFRGKAYSMGMGLPLSEPIDRACIENELRFVSGASMLVTRTFLEQVGLMCEDYFLYFEELDWAERSRGHFKLAYAPQSIVRHKVGASIGTSDFGNRSTLSDYYMNRSTIKFCWRHSKISLPIVLSLVARDAVRWCRQRQWSRAAILARAALGLPYQA
ncbi:glycosyltransferase family 2 protein [Bradyrhizobium sp. MOS003]|nr:glycosyltransferase family 2 protein [Bradyrhizobium sp. MOS003]